MTIPATRELLTALLTRHDALFDRLKAEFDGLKAEKLKNSDKPGVLSTIETRLSVLRKAKTELSTAAGQWSAARDSFQAERTTDVGPIVRLLDAVEATLNAESKPVSAPKPTAPRDPQPQAKAVPVPTPRPDTRPEGDQTIVPAPKPTAPRDPQPGTGTLSDGDLAALMRGVLPASHAAVIREFSPQDLRVVLDGSVVVTGADRELLTLLHALLPDNKAVKNLQTALKVAGWLNKFRTSKSDPS